MKKVHRPHGEVATRLATQAYCHPDWQGLAMQAHALDLKAPIESLRAVERLDRAQIQILPHQVNAVMTAVNRLRTRAILADEVGLGKTIEAGLIVKEYLARGLVRRVLILTPAPLTTQWRGELFSKFGERFAIADPGGLAKLGPDELPFEAWDRHPLLIASLDTAKQDEHAAAILAQRWDLIVIDEAHRLKNAATKAYRFVESLRSRYLLLLTATPIQNNLHEVYNLVHLVQEGLLGTPEHFRDTFIADKNGRVLKQPERLGALLRKVMVRHRRADVGITFADRKVETVLLEGSPAEHALHDAVLDYVRGPQGPADAPARGMKALTYIRLSRMMASSPQALASSVRQMLPEVADSGEAVALARILELARAVERGSKAEALLKALRELDDRAIVFTSFYETQRHLVQLLEQEGWVAIPFGGNLSQRDKDAAVARFKELPKSVLIATDAGSEGVNLQFCHALVNYDLPWNPMRVEQRIGRVHRIGQTRDVVVMNMAIRDTVEEYILQLLEQKIRLFTHAVGETDLILSNLRGVESFEKAILEVIAKARAPRELRYQFEAFGESLELARRAAEQVKAFDSETLALLDLSALEGVDPASPAPAAPLPPQARAAG